MIKNARHPDAGPAQAAGLGTGVGDRGADRVPDRGDAPGPVGPGEHSGLGPPDDLTAEIGDPGPNPAGADIDPGDPAGDRLEDVGAGRSSGTRGPTGRVGPDRTLHDQLADHGVDGRPGQPGGDSQLGDGQRPRLVPQHGQAGCRVGLADSRPGGILWWHGYSGRRIAKPGLLITSLASELDPVNQSARIRPA